MATPGLNRELGPQGHEPSALKHMPAKKSGIATPADRHPTPPANTGGQQTIVAASAKRQLYRMSAFPHVMPLGIATGTRHLPLHSEMVKNSYTWA